MTQIRQQQQPHCRTLLQKPRTVTKTEQIERAVPVEREVTVEKAFTEYVEVRPALVLIFAVLCQRRCVLASIHCILFHNGQQCLRGGLSRPRNVHRKCPRCDNAKNMLRAS